MASVSSSVLDDNTSEHKRRLGGKLIYFTGSLVAVVVAEIVVANLIIEVASTLTAVDDWGADTRGAMIKLEHAFCERKSPISQAVLSASLISALLLVVIASIMGVTAARFGAGGIVGPINQLIYVVYGLDRMDFSRQAPRTWMEARDSEDPDQAKALMEATQDSFADAVTNYELAINNAEMLCAATNQQPNGASPLHPSVLHDGREGADETKARGAETQDYHTWLREIDEWREARRKRLIKAMEFGSTPFCKKLNDLVMGVKLAFAFADTLCPGLKIAAEILHWSRQTTKSQKKKLRCRLRLRLRRRVHLYRRRLRRRRNRRRRHRRRRHRRSR
ncbi:unnamed protein product [Ectocarpus sp. 6 AP-2014]